MELNMGQTYSLNGLSIVSLEMRPQLTLTREIPKHLNPKAIERALECFVSEVDVKGDQVGFIQQTLEKIAAATYLRVPGEDFWLADEEGEVAGYVLARITRDIDNSLVYWVSQGWCHPKYRNGKHLKESWKELENQARKYLCKHIVNVTNRNPEAYKRILGEGWENYSTILKKDLRD